MPLNHPLGNYHMLTKFFSNLFPKRAEPVVQDIRTAKKIVLAKNSLQKLSEVKSFSPVIAGGLYFKSTDVNIVEFYDRLKNLHLAYLEGNLTPSMCFVQLQDINLDKFFTHEGVYVDQSSLRELVRLGLNFINDISVAVEKDDPAGHYAERLLSKIFVTIYDLEQAVSKAVVK